MQTLLEKQYSLLIFAVFVSAVVSLMTTIAWSFFDIERKKILIFSVGLVAVFVIFFLPYHYFWLYRNFHLIGVRLQLLCPIMLLMTTIFVIGNIRGKQFAAGFSYLFNLVFLLLGLEALKSAGGTWGNSNLDFGLYIVLSGFFILQVLTYLCESNFFYGILKLSSGIISTVIIIVWGLNRGDESWISDREIFSREILIFVTVLLIIEGLLLIYKSRKNLTQRKL